MADCHQRGEDRNAALSYPNLSCHLRNVEDELNTGGQRHELERQSPKIEQPHDQCEPTDYDYSNEARVLNVHAQNGLALGLIRVRRAGCSTVFSSARAPLSRFPSPFVLLDTGNLTTFLTGDRVPLEHDASNKQEQRHHHQAGNEQQIGSR
jgi:hypothetical protein